MIKAKVKVRKGQAPGKLSRATFRARFFDKLSDPAFRARARISSSHRGRRFSRRCEARFAGNGSVLAKKCDAAAPAQRRPNVEVTLARALSAEPSALARIEVIAWDGYSKHRQAPLTHPAGRGYADPSYDLSDEWRAARQAIRAAEKRQKDPASPSRVLVIRGIFSRRRATGDQCRTDRRVSDRGADWPGDHVGAITT